MNTRGHEIVAVECPRCGGQGYVLEEKFAERRVGDDRRHPGRRFVSSPGGEVLKRSGRRQIANTRRLGADRRVS